MVGLIGADYGTVDADENDKWDGLSLYTYQENDPGGTWRAIFMASDNGGVGSPEWRTHTPLRMLTANNTWGRGAAMYIFRYDEGDPWDVVVGHAACGATGAEGWGTGCYVYGWYPQDRVVGRVPANMQVAWVAPGEDPLLQEEEHLGNVKGYELECAQRISDAVRGYCVGTSGGNEWLTPAGVAQVAEWDTTKPKDVSWSALLKYNNDGAGPQMTRLYWAIVGGGTYSFSCSQYAAANTRTFAAYEAFNPLALDNRVMSAHCARTTRTDPFGFARGRYSRDKQIESHDCYWCRHAEGRWSGPHSWDVVE